MNLAKYFRDLIERWPSAFVSRTDAHKFSGGAVTSKTLANHDSLGTGPTERFRIGRRIVYPVGALASWLQERADDCPRNSTEN